MPLPITIEARLTAIKNEIDRAIDDYTQAIELDTDYADAYYNRGNACHNKREYDRAIVDYNRAIELKPNYAEAYYNRGVTYSEKSDFDSAIGRL